MAYTKYIKYIDSDGCILSVDILKNNTKFYFNYKGQFHRLDGPAIEYPNGNYSWYKEGISHRIGGPAYCWKHILSWCINDKLVNIYYICG